MSEEYQENKKEQVQSQQLSIGRVPIGERTLGFYFCVIKAPVFCSAVLGILYLFSYRTRDAIFTIYFLAFCVVAISVLRREKGTFKETVTACGLAGLFLGFMDAVFQFAITPKLHLFFNVLSEPIFIMGQGMSIGAVAAWISRYAVPAIHPFAKTLQFGLKKGGEFHDRKNV